MICTGCFGTSTTQGFNSKVTLLSGTFDFQNDFLWLLCEWNRGEQKGSGSDYHEEIGRFWKGQETYKIHGWDMGKKPKEKAKNKKKKGRGNKKESFYVPLDTSRIVPKEKSVGAENGVELSKVELIWRKWEEFFQKHGKGIDKSGKPMKSDAPKEKGQKAPQVWALGGCANKEDLDYSSPTTNGAPDVAPPEHINLIQGTRSESIFRILTAAAQMMKGPLKTLPNLVLPRGLWVPCLECWRVLWALRACTGRHGICVGQAVWSPHC